MSNSTGVGVSGAVCTSPACVHAASEILMSLATNYTDIDPCADFAQCKYLLPWTRDLAIAEHI
jgi:hypothetical protein